MDLVLNPNRKVYVISDTHYNHKNICKATSGWSDTTLCRNYNSLDSMNKAIIGVMNVPEPEDIIIHMGDWSFGGFDSIAHLRRQIRCQSIYLVYGNHDHHIKDNRDSIQDEFICTADYLEVMYGKYSFVCFHYPITSWHGMNKGVIQLHGHVHLQPQYAMHSGRAMDVGYDGLTLMQPYDLNVLAGTLSRHPIKTLTLPHDHHENEVR